MYDDFWSGYNSGNGLTAENPFSSGQAREIKKEMYAGAGRPGTSFDQTAGTYNKSKIIKMVGPNAEKGEIYANGKMYIEFPDKRPIQVRTFPSRPWGIRYMQKRGWVVV